MCYFMHNEGYSNLPGFEFCNGKVEILFVLSNKFGDHFQKVIRIWAKLLYVLYINIFFMFIPWQNTRNELEIK